ncbi:hypothetical protein POI8812_03334 [Pontivivens insulae]|uniref:Uncharacterized protein n=1 Tax=Pontivivens insulae TaxID=1639689 RepID=A0A2R8AFK7_9RHOB|nr:hypothetical protein POI8812_03334 [Pontivivens insulae]
MGTTRPLGLGLEGNEQGGRRCVVPVGQALFAPAQSVNIDRKLPYGCFA